MIEILLLLLTKILIPFLLLQDKLSLGFVVNLELLFDFLDDILELSILSMSTILTIGHEHNVNFSHMCVLKYDFPDILENREEISATNDSECINFLIILPLLIT